VATSGKQGGGRSGSEAEACLEEGGR
jgi:hypothetical protein